MAVYSVQTRLSPDEVIQKAHDFFGESGLGLEGYERSFCCTYFEGGGGYVLVTVECEGEKTKTDVELETREWDYDVQEFMQKIA